MRIIFMGTPDFAVPSLSILLEAGYEIVAVVTAPDKPAGRGRKLRPSPVKVFAQEHDIEVLQPVKLRDPEFLARLHSLEPELMVVVAFRMLPKLVWEIPSKGTFNLHSSLLPDYRGAAPINWVVINGETQTGVTTFMIDEQIDTGNILLTEEHEIPHTWTAGDLHDHLMEKGAELVLRTVQGIGSEELIPKPQDDSKFLHHAPKIFPDDCRIDWDRPARDLYNHVRGLSPYPTAWTTLNQEKLKIYFLAESGEKTDQSPGTLRRTQKPNELWVSSADEWLKVNHLQLQGKKRMAIQDFLNGFKGELNQFV